MDNDEKKNLADLSTPKLRVDIDGQPPNTATAKEVKDASKEHWQVYCPDLCTRGLCLLKSGSWTDVAFSVGDNEDYIEAHRLMLASASPVFAAMLYGPLAENNSVIRIPDVTIEIFIIMLEFIYMNNIQSITIEKLPEIDYISKKYIIPRLMKGFASGLKKNLNINNVIQCYEFAAAVEYQPLIEECDEIFSSQTEHLFASFATDSLVYADMETLQHILSLDSLAIESELELLSIVERVAEANGIEKKSDDNAENTDGDKKPSIRPLLQQIRFLGLEPSVLADQHQRLREFFNDAELLVLMLHANSASSVPMLPGFSTNRNPRNMKLPVLLRVPGEVTVGRVFYVRGTVHRNASRFDINLQNGEDPSTLIPLHISVRVLENCVVRNTYQRGWGPEERGGGMAFVRGRRFQATIRVEDDQFKIEVNGSHVYTYIYRVPINKVTHFGINGDVIVHELSF